MSPPLPPFLFLHALLERVANPDLRRLLLLASVGETGPYAFSLSEEFKSIGVLHLLVLSGSQVQHFSSPLRWSLLGLSRRWPPVARESFVRAGVACGLLVFGAGVGWSAPLARAVFMGLLALAFPRLRREVRFVLSLAIHLAVFPEHARQLGFHLSWLSCLALALAGEFGLRGIWKIGFVTCVAQIAAAWLLGAASASEFGLPWLLLTNVVVGWIFDAWLMPTLGVVTVLSFLCMPTGISEALAESAAARALAAFPLEGMGRLVLVAIRAFRYIGGA